MQAPNGTWNKRYSVSLSALHEQCLVKSRSPVTTKFNLNHVSFRVSFILLVSSIFRLDLVQEQVYADIPVTCSMKSKTLLLQA